MESNETIDKIKQQISENPILLYMKGSPKLPSCGFSSQASQVKVMVLNHSPTGHLSSVEASAASSFMEK